MSRIEQEKKTVATMIGLYCHAKHHGKPLCKDCQMLHEYALSRLEHCPFGNQKTFCQACHVHCYKPEMRTKIKEVMRFSGPRLLLYHPVMALKHLHEMRKVKKAGASL